MNSNREWNNPRWSIHHGDCLAWLRTLDADSVDAIVTDPPAGIAFMGRAWDGDKGGRAQWVAWLAEVMRECLRVLKPGGHALVWSLPRTEHWTACAVEDAGFEIRDGVYHLCAQGWPKSLDVSKAIDDLHGAERTTVARAGVKSGTAPDGATYAGGLNVGFQQRELTAPETLEAARWSGWGTGLKPAVEKWVLARKPLAGTVAENVLTHGVGALNVDGCRVESGARPLFSRTANESDSATYSARGGAACVGETTLGRWPSNAVLSHAETCGDECDEACPVRELDRQSGVTKSSAQPRRTSGTQGYRKNGTEFVTGGHDDEGGASRFFPVFHPFGYFGKAKSASQRGGAENAHPTVKNLDLMRWLVRLVTPRGGLVLDAFGGSGSTGVAALLEGCRFTAAEQDAEHYAFARRRLEAAERGETVVRPTAAASSDKRAAKESTGERAQRALFEGDELRRSKN